MNTLYKGILIDQSVDSSESILALCHRVSDRHTTLEAEEERGDVQFIHVEVDEHNIWPVLECVAESLKSPGWYFHLVGNGKLYVVYPGVVFTAHEGNDQELEQMITFGISIGIHPDQLDLGKLYENPYA